MASGHADYAPDIAFPLTIQQGGTGQISLTVNGVVLGNSTSPVNVTAAGAANQVLQIPAASGAPVFQGLAIDASTITGIVPIANGGTATATPALLPGANIAISGSWPDQTVALLASPSITTLSVTPTVSPIGIQLFGNTTGPVHVGLEFVDATANADRGWLGLAEAPGDFITVAVAGDICLRATTGNLYLGTSIYAALKIDPSQVVTLAHPLPIASGGTATATPALVAGTGISLAGAWPDTTITNTSAYATLAVPLPIASGGTATATPALVAGANIAISGSWPDQAVALLASPSITTLSVTPTVNASGIQLFGNTTGPVSVHLFLVDATANVERGLLGLAEASGEYVTSAAVGDIVLRATTGSLYLGTSIYAALKIDQSQIVTLTHPLPIASGGTATATPALVAGTGISLAGAWPDQTITNTSAYATLAVPLPIASGGTATATPALVAGESISITGAWPAQTIALTGVVNSVELICTGPIASETPTSGVHMGVFGSTPRLVFGDPTQSHEIDVSSGNLRIYRPGALDLNINSAGLVTLTTPLPVASGGTGTATPALVAGANIAITGTWPDQTIAVVTSPSIPSLVAQVDQTGISATVAATTFYTAAAAGQYRFSASVYLDVTAAATGTVYVAILHTDHATQFSNVAASLSTGNTGQFVSNLVATFWTAYADIVQWSLTNTGAATFSADVHIRLEAI